MLEKDYLLIFYPFCYPEDWKSEISSRLKIMNDCIDKINTLISTKSLIIKSKKFYYLGSTEYPSRTNKSIYTLSKICWDLYKKRKSPYKYDGLIYTPMYLPVGYNNTNDYLLLLGRTWLANLKWKPPSENSIDFLVETEKEVVFKSGTIEITRDIVRDTNYVDRHGETIAKKYKVLNLYVGGNIYNTTNICQFGKTDRYPKGYGKKIFNPVLPYVENAHQAPILMSNNQLLSEDDNNLIEDGTVVECSYNESSDNEFKWIAKRTRYDKTYEYQTSKNIQKNIYIFLKHLFYHKQKDGTYKKLSNFVSHYPYWKRVRLSKNERLNFDYNRRCLRGQRYLDAKTFLKLVEKYHHDTSKMKNSLFTYLQQNFETTIPNEDVIPLGTKYGQNEEVANNIWLTIHHPVTEQMITTGKEIPPIEAENEVYYDTGNTHHRTKSETIRLQKFHNFIKRNVLIIPASNHHGLVKKSNINTLLDLACGKGGDLPKWRDANLDLVVGIDVSRDNIENTRDGACIRYDNMITIQSTREESYPSVYFLSS